MLQINQVEVAIQHFSLGGKTYKHHRVVYARSKGITISAIAGLVILHKCDNKLCVNPDHLMVGTQKDNSAGYAS